MIDELEWLSDQRPAVSPPSEEVRAAALAQLERAIAREHEPRRRRALPRLGWLGPTVALACAILIAGGAIVLLHRAPVQAGASGGVAGGRIVDRNGELLAGYRAITFIRVRPQLLPRGSARAAEARLLASLVGSRHQTLLPCEVAPHRTQRLTLVQCIVETDQGDPRRIVLPISVWDRAGSAVAAHRAQLPGVTMWRGTERIPYGSLGSQVLSGVDSEYASSLKAGDTVKLTLDARLQRKGEHALSKTIAFNRATGGAFVALDPQNGQVLAMGSSHNGPDPLIDRAIQAAGPSGSAFTPITATAALESGKWTVGDTYDDTGQYCFPGTNDCLHNSGHVANGVLNLVSALRVSDGLFFYHLGALMNDDLPHGGSLQDWARGFGIGEPTGIDLPGEIDGTLPTPAGQPARSRWSVGDNVNMAVGQGEVQVTPLQLAVAYAALANGGTVVTPHVAQDIQTSAGTVLRQIDPPPRRRLNIDPLYRRTILEGLRQSASAPGGTSDDVFGNFPEQVYGKTGTAQYISSGHEQDYAWYAGFVSATATSKPIVVVVWVQQGGFGDIAAAPVARQILSQWFLGHPGPWRAGSSATL